MPVGLEARCKETLDEVVTVSDRICRSALSCANTQNFSVFDRLHRRLETIRTSAHSILVAFTKTSLTSDTLDDRIIDWLLSGELSSCLDKLKEMDNVLKSDGQVRALARPLTSFEDKLTAATSFFDKHSSLFHFLLTPDVWNREVLHHQPPQLDTNPQETQSSSTSDHSENRPPSTVEQPLTIRDKILFQQKMGAVLRWLTPLDCMEKHKQTLQLRQEGTCTWLPKTDAYRKWRTGSGNQFLWLHGKAGCGKSVLVASTIEHLKNTLRDDEVLVFFYCDFRNERSTIPSELMRSLLSQLFRHFCDCGIDPGDFPNKILEAKSKGTLSLDDLDKLCDLVMRATLYFPCNPTIIIDALEECADIEALVCALTRFKRADVRVLVTSRPHQTIMDHLVEFQSLSFEDMAKELAGDMASHITRVVDSDNQLRSADLDMKKEIRAKLSERAEGRFRWVQCQLDNLKRCVSREELREALDNLPNELEATYERILGAIDERKLEGKLARRALAWLMVALQPLQLARIVDGLSANPHQSGIDRKAVGTALLHALSSLVSYSEQTDLVVLSHFSVKEYLTSATALPVYQITPHEAHVEVAQTCMQYISTFLKQWPFRGNAALLQSFPMLSYVLSPGFNHLAHVNPDSSLALETLRSLGADVRHHPSNWERLCELREEHFGWPYPPWPSSRHDFVPYILIAYASPALLQSFLSSGGPLKSRVGTNPLVYAADLRKTEHAMALLGCGADVNVRGFVVDDSRHALPLDVAIDAGDGVLVGELLQRGCVVTSDILTTAVCMPWCSTPVLVKLMQAGEFVEWARQIGDEKLYRAVFNSARPNIGDRGQADGDHVTLARILRQIGQDLSADSQFGAELIERSIHAAHTSMLEFPLPQDQPPHPRFLLAASTGDTPETVSMVRFLLRKGVDIHAVSDWRRDTALHLAVMCPWEPRRLELTKLLIDSGCGPHARNSRGETPLTIAVEHGYISVVELLLSHNVSLPSNILHFGLERGWDPQMVLLLIQKDADVHSTAPNGDTLLHLAITKYDESRRLDLVKILIEAGCNPTTVNTAHKSSLEVAIERRHTSVIEFLLSCNIPLPPDTLLFALRRQSPLHLVESLIRKGVDLHSTTSNGDTLLHLAMTEYDESRRLNLVEIFIKAGCDPAGCNSQGRTALEAAIERGYTSTVELLLSSNVSFPSDILLFALQRYSPLHMVELLIRKGADVHSTTSNGDTVFHLAMTGHNESRCLDLVQILIEAGCNPTTINAAHKSSLEVAIERRHTSVVEFLLSRNIPFPPDTLLFALQRQSPLHMVESLIRKGVDLHSTTSNGDTVLHLAMTGYDEPGCLDLVKILIEAGCNPTIVNSRGKSGLEVAIKRRHTSVVEFLLSRDVPFPPDILLFVLRHSPLYMVQSLIRNGADVRSTTSNGDTVLHLAMTQYSDESRRLALVKILIEAGCDPTVINSQGESGLELAIERGHISVVAFLLSCNVQFPPDILLFAVQRHSPLYMVEFLIHNGADVRSVTSNGDTVLHLAMSEYDESTKALVKILIEAGCNPTTVNHEGKSALEVAIEYGHTSVVKFLLSWNVPFPPDILLFALRHSSLYMVQFLIHNGADVRSTMSNGDTLLHLALTERDESRRLDAVKILIIAGCNPAGCNSDGRTVLEAAIEQEYTSVVKLLLSYSVPFPPDSLLFALGRRCTPQMIQLLVQHSPDNPTMLFGSNWDNIHQLVNASYPGQDCQQVIEVLEVARNARRTCPSPGPANETPVHVAKRPRLSE